MSLFYWIIASLFLSFSSMGCASYCQLPQEARHELPKQYQGRSVELKQSCYYGEFYDDNDHFLLSPYAFEHTSHLVDWQNQPIHPQQQIGILPAGTRFMIQDIRFPTAWEISQRMLITPRYHPWLILRLSSEKEGIPYNHKPFILVLPDGLKSPQEVEQAISVLLGREGEISHWLAKLSEDRKQAIASKTLLEAMSSHEMLASQGLPWYIFEEKSDTDGKSVEVAWYPHQEVWLKNGHVLTIKPSRFEPEQPILNNSNSSLPAQTQDHSNINHTLQEGDENTTPSSLLGSDSDNDTIHETTQKDLLFQ